MTTVDICIATYKRAEWLKQLLDSLADQDLPEATRMRAIVVDNDPAESGRAVVERFASDRLQVVYFTQQVKNISLTRNVALDHAEADWLALVDDDEFVPRHWLSTLLACQRRFEADAVFGPVGGLLPADAPAWIRSGGFFDPQVRSTGSVLPFGACNNALLSKRLLRNGIRFDPRFGLTGGEDTHFFHRLSSQGARLIWCQEAQVSEHLPAARLSLGWILRRQFRGGQSYADIVGRPNGPLRVLGWLSVRTGLLLAALAWAVLSIPGGFGAVLRAFGKVAANAGQISTVFHYRFNEYR
ncbi:glycosyl transferase [Burkholderiales bacterium JOSHI_001]|nr:glycosyl transferase [Burkholderiales bacterium JOSHI_001]